MTRPHFFMKPRIAYFLNALGVGGTEKTATIFAHHLRDHFDFTFFTYDDADVTRQHEVERLEYISRVNPDFSVLSNYDLVHSFRSGNPERPHPGIDFKAKFVETNVFGLLDPSRHINKTLFMSKWLMNESLSSYGVSGSRFDFLNNPVYKPFSEEKMDLGLPSSTIILGRCGRSDPGIYDSINVDAAKLLCQAGYHVHFLVVAAPQPMIRDLEMYQIPHTCINETVDPIELSKFYNTVDIYCHARADGETFGVNIAEAMIHGLPVITHIAKPSNPYMSVFQSQTELVDRNVTGFIANNMIEYADNMRLLYVNEALRLKMGMAGKSKALREYCVDSVALKLKDEYDKLLG